MPIQVNGKLRGTLQVERNAEQIVVEPRARITVSSWLANKEIVKVIFVKDRLINFVIK
jgi:leucyl-tRNA synthetase